MFPFHNIFKENSFKESMNSKKESRIGLKEYAIENGKKVDLSILKSSIKGSKEYSEGRKVMVRACNDIFIEYEGGILLVERDNFPAKGSLWCIGGGVEKGILIEDSLREKVKEECNLELEAIEFIGVSRALWETDPAGQGKGVDDISLVYFGKGKGNLKLNNLHKSPIIVKPENYSKLKENLHPWIRDFMDKLMPLLNKNKNSPS